MKKKQSINKENKKHINKRNIILSSLFTVVGLSALSVGLAYGAISSSKDHATNLNVGPNTNVSTSAITPNTTSTLFANFAPCQLPNSPLILPSNNNKQTSNFVVVNKNVSLSDQILNKLNTLPFLSGTVNVGNSSNNSGSFKLNVIGTYLLNFASLNVFSTIWKFGALKLQNTYSFAVQININNGNKIISQLIIPANSIVWIANNVKTGWLVYNQTFCPINSYNSDSFNSVFTSSIDSVSQPKTNASKNGITVLTPPKVPVLTPYDVAQKTFMQKDSSGQYIGKNIVLSDLYNMQAAFLNKSINVVFMGHPANVEFSALNFQLENAVYYPASYQNNVYVPAKLFVPSITGSMKITVYAATGSNAILTTLNLAICDESGYDYHYLNSSNQSESYPFNGVTFTINPLVMNSATQTYPSTSAFGQDNNQLTGISFSVPGSWTPSKDAKLGYYIQSTVANEPYTSYINLYQEQKDSNGQYTPDKANPFTTVNISWGALFYDFWMINHNGFSSTCNSTTNKVPTQYEFNKTASSFGSVYLNGSSPLTSSQSKIPSNWICAINNSDADSTYEFNLNELNLNANILNNINPFINDSAQSIDLNDNLVQKQNTIYSALQNALVEQNPWLSYQELSKIISIQLNLQPQSIANGVYSWELNNIGLYNNNVVSLSNDNTEINNAIYYLKVKVGQENNILDIYPTTNKEQCISWLSNVGLHIPININFNNINWSLNLNNTNNLDAEQCYDLLQTNNSNLYDSLLNSLQSQINNKNIQISNLSFKLLSDNQLICDGFSIKNISHQAQGFNYLSSVNNNNVTNSIFINPGITYNVSNININVNGFVYFAGNVQSKVDIASSLQYANLLSNNFNVLNTNSTHFKNMCTVLNNLLLPTSQNDLAITNYVINNQQEQAQTSLNLQSITILNNSNNGCCININNQIFYLKPKQNTICNLKTNNYISLTNFKTEIEQSNNQLIKDYLNLCYKWLNTLSLTEIKKQFSFVAQVNQFYATMPTPGEVHYTNSNNQNSFTYALNSYDQQNHVLNIQNITWTAWGNSPVSYSVNIASGNVSCQLVPVLYYQLKSNTKTPNKVYSFPQIIAKGCNEYFGFNTEISTVLSYANYPDLNDMVNIRFGYYLQQYPDVQNNIPGSNGLAIKTNSSSKPYLNFANAFNNFSMMQNGNNTIGNNTNYGSYIQPNIQAPSNNDLMNINPAFDDVINFNKTIAFQNEQNASSTSYINVINYASLLQQTLSLPNTLSINSITWIYNSAGVMDGLSSFSVQNNSNITYKLIYNNQVAQFVTPFSNQVVNLPLQFTNVNSNATQNASINLSTLYDNDNAGAVSYYGATDGYGYPLVWTQPNYNCLSYDAADAYYWWNQGQKLFTVTEPTWGCVIHTADAPTTVHLSWVAQILNLPISDHLNGYSIYVNAVSNGSGSYPTYIPTITNIEVNGVWSNVNIAINMGSAFWFC